MNWRRGLIRLWLLVSVLWLAAIFVVTRPYRDQMLPWHTPIVIRVGRQVFKFPRTITRASLADALIILARRDPHHSAEACDDVLKSAEQTGRDPYGATLNDTNCLDDPPETPTEFGKNTAAILTVDAGRIVEFVMLGIAPIIGLFTLGAVMFWAISGFRRA